MSIFYFFLIFIAHIEIISISNDIYLTPPLGQDMTQGRFFLSGV